MVQFVSALSPASFRLIHVTWCTGSRKVTSHAYEIEAVYFLFADRARAPVSQNSMQIDEQRERMLNAVNNPLRDKNGGMTAPRREKGRNL